MTPNQLTWLRIMLGIICAFILIRAHSAAWFALYAVLFILAAVTDLLDGYMARKMKLESDFGRIADPIADKILNIGSFFALSYRGVFSFWWLIPIIAREVVITAIRIVKVKQGKILPAEFAGKLKTTIQYVTIGISFISLILNHYISNETVLQVSSFLVLITLFSTVALTLYSGFVFLKKNFG